MGYDVRQDKPYRRGLILGLTMAEIMILLIFLLLMVLASALAAKEKRLAIYENGVASRMVEVVQAAYPEVQNPDDYFKELVRAIEAHKALKKHDEQLSPVELIEDAELGRTLREAAESQGVSNPRRFAEKAIEKAAKGKKGEWPPFFSLSEAGGYYFESGKATLKPDFLKKLKQEIIPLLKKNIEDYDVDVVEVIGHTDEVPMNGISNLDQNLIAATANKLDISRLSSSDNAGLAIARAASVVSVLRADPHLSGVTILPLSGAQLIIPVDSVADGSANTSDQTRRRIEIRLRRSTQQFDQSS